MASSLDLEADAELPWWSRTYQGYQQRFVHPYSLELRPNLRLDLRQAPCVSAAHAREAKASADGSCTASTVWDAGIVLAALVYRLGKPAEGTGRSSCCLDLGSGTGIVGLSAAASGAFHTVVLTDLPSVVPLLEQNTAGNAATIANVGSTWQRDGAGESGEVDCEGSSSGGAGSGSSGGSSSSPRVVSRALAWDDARQLAQVAVEHGPFDFIVGGDLLYRPQVVAPLLNALTALASAQTTVLLAASLQHSPQTIGLFAVAAVEAGFEVERIDHHADGAVPEAFASVEVRILRLRRARRRSTGSGSSPKKKKKEEHKSSHAAQGRGGEEQQQFSKKRSREPGAT